MALCPLRPFSFFVFLSTSKDWGPQKPALELATEEHPEEHHVVAAQLLCELGPTLGEERCVRDLLPVIPSLADDSSFSVRKAIALNLGKLCRVVGPERAEAEVVSHDTRAA